MGLFDSIFGGSAKSSPDNNPDGPNNGRMDSNFGPPIHGTDREGRDVTVSFGREGRGREGHTLISDGHQSSSDFWGRDSSGEKNHDHADGKGGYNDRGKYSGEK